MYLYTKNVKKSAEIMFAYSCFNMILLIDKDTYMLFNANNVLCDVALIATFAVNFN